MPKISKSLSKTSIAIAGTAGRKEDKDKLSKKLYEGMVSKTLETILYKVPEELLSQAKPTLVSGGAAVADHIAVVLFLTHPDIFDLKLCFPCPFTKGSFEDTKAKEWFNNPGKTANYYHRQFSQLVGRDSLGEIQKAIKQGAEVYTGKGFHERNIEMAKSDIAITLTFSEEGIKDGGTKHMSTHYIKLHPDNRYLYHISLPKLEIQRIV